MSKRQLPYVISYDAKGDFWYCHMRGYADAPVIGSLGDKSKAQKICDMMNKSVWNVNYALNLNDTIKVKLTDHGKDIFYHRFDDLIAKGVKLTPKMPKVDADGYTTFQLWDFIQLYGQYIGMALPNVIEPIDIVIEGKVLKQLGEFSVSEVE